MEYTIYLAVVFILTLVIGILTYFQRKNFLSQEEKTETAAHDEGAVQRRTRGAPAPVVGSTSTRNRAQAGRSARARMRAAQAQQHAHSDSEGGGSDDSLEDEYVPEGKTAKKQQARLDRKAEKKATKEAEEQKREEKREREERRIEDQKLKEQQEEEEEAKRLEEEKRIREEEERREQEEYEEMKAAFSVEEEGFEQNEDEENEKNLLQQFITYIKDSKVVVLEDLGATFQMKTQSVIDRITDLLKEGTLTGVIDDRGKFIYITMEELQNVAKFIKQRGRITIPELAEASNSLINLTGAGTESVEG